MQKRFSSYGSRVLSYMLQVIFIATEVHPCQMYQLSRQLSLDKNEGTMFQHFHLIQNANTAKSKYMTPLFSSPHYNERGCMHKSEPEGLLESKLGKFKGLFNGGAHSSVSRKILKSPISNYDQADAADPLKIERVYSSNYHFMKSARTE